MEKELTGLFESSSMLEAEIHFRFFLSQCFLLLLLFGLLPTDPASLADDCGRGLSEQP